MKMSIARALKERKRIIGEMNTIRDRINIANAVQITVKLTAEGKIPEISAEEIAKNRKLDPRKLMDEWYRLRDRLVSLKTALQAANGGIAGKLILLTELKAELQLVENMPSYDNGSQYVNDPFVRITDVVFDSQYINSRIDRLRTDINSCQDEIDEYNATHYVEIAD